MATTNYLKLLMLLALLIQTCFAGALLLKVSTTGWELVAANRRAFRFIGIGVSQVWFDRITISLSRMFVTVGGALLALGAAVGAPIGIGVGMMSALSHLQASAGGELGSIDTQSLSSVLSAAASAGSVRSLSSVAASITSQTAVDVASMRASAAAQASADDAYYRTRKVSLSGDAYTFHRRATSTMQYPRNVRRTAGPTQTGWGPEPVEGKVKRFYPPPATPGIPQFALNACADAFYDMIDAGRPVTYDVPAERSLMISGLPFQCMNLVAAVGNDPEYPDLRPIPMGSDSVRWDGVDPAEVAEIKAFFIGTPPKTAWV